MANPEQKGKVQTVLGLIEPEDVGVTLMHEPLFADGTVSGYYFKEPDAASDRILAHQPVSVENLWFVRYRMKDNLDNLMLLDEDTAVKEAMLYKLRGGSTLVDQTNIGIARDPLGIARVSRATGLNVVMGCGYYVEDSYPSKDHVTNSTVEELGDEMVRDIQVGVGATRIRSGMIGELGCSWPLRDNERKVLQAGAYAQKETGASINVHPGRAPQAITEIADVLEAAGADLSRVVISHMDRCGYPLDVRKRLLDRGCVLEYDVFGMEGYYPARSALMDGVLPDILNDIGRIKEIKELINLGYLGQIAISHDIGMKMMLTRYGGWGYAHILRDVVPMMQVYGITEDQIDTLLVKTPRRLLTFV
ncbi:MAG TPA: aryldialkylphosphatase [Phycisphaerae bacterium]|nr:aryldialkylphosphatase [Phycisphaerae bacterium]